MKLKINGTCGKAFFVYMNYPYMIYIEIKPLTVLPKLQNDYHNRSCKTSLNWRLSYKKLILIYIYKEITDWKVK